MTVPMREPTLGEVALALERFEREVVRRFDEIGAHLRQTVLTEVYEAQRQAMVAQISEARTEIDQARTEARRELADLRDELDAERRERRADRRIYISALLSLLVLIIGAGLVAALGWK